MGDKQNMYTLLSMMRLVIISFAKDIIGSDSQMNKY